MTLEKNGTYQQTETTNAQDKYDWIMNSTKASLPQDRREALLAEQKAVRNILACLEGLTTVEAIRVLVLVLDVKSMDAQLECPHSTYQKNNHQVSEEASGFLNKEKIPAPHPKEFRLKTANK